VRNSPRMRTVNTLKAETETHSLKPTGSPMVMGAAEIVNSDTKTLMYWG
jgi:hypothetical protein